MLLLLLLLLLLILLLTLLLLIVAAALIVVVAVAVVVVASTVLVSAALVAALLRPRLLDGQGDGACRAGAVRLPHVKGQRPRSASRCTRPSAHLELARRRVARVARRTRI